jgi:NADH:ubiquinone oxidoreductase subunit K
MNKYQKAAALDLIKIAGIVVTVGITLNILALYFTVPEILIGLGMILMIYTGYNLFLMRVDQLKSMDEIRERQSK